MNFGNLIVALKKLTNFEITEPVNQRQMTKERARAVRACTARAHALRLKNSQIFSLAQKTNLLHPCCLGCSLHDISPNYELTIASQV